MKYYVSNAIKYVNDEPHIGHGYEEIISDVISRYHRQQGSDVLLVTGLDEHSSNVFKKAKEKGLDTLEYCNQMEQKFTRTWNLLNISYDNFIRTTSKQHKDSVIEIYNRIKANGDIYEGKYKGLYCQSCESYKEPSESPDNKCQIHKISLQTIEETNLFFRLSKYKDKIVSLLQTSQLKISPDYRKNELIAFLAGELKDISISRHKAPWGIDVPDYKDQKFYIWFDALINYLTACGFPSDTLKFQKYWPCDVHVIGKDIARFHCVLWPSMLISAGIELPKNVLIHGFISLGGEKLSKTTGNILKPDYVCEKFGIDSVRYFLLRESPVGGDVDFSEEKLIERYKRDLANDLGNLVQRTVAMSAKYFNANIEIGVFDKEISDQVDEINLHRRNCFNSLLLSDSLSKIWELVRFSNAYVERKAPWSLAKQNKKEELKNTMFSLLESIKWISYFSYPFIPETCAKIFTILGMPTDLPTSTLMSTMTTRSYKLNPSEVLFPKLENDTN